MQIAFVGLGRMGGYMVQRILRDSNHKVVAFDFNQEAVVKALRQLRNRGWIETGRREIRVLNMQALVRRSS